MEHFIDKHSARHTLDNLSTAVMVLDSALRLEYLNPACEMLLASSARRHLGHSLRELLPHGQPLIELAEKVLASNHPCTEREMTLTLPDLRTAIIDCTVTPFATPTDSNGLLVEMLSMDRHLRIAREEQLQTQFQATREVMRGLAHEIKNPLGGLRGSAQLLERELESPELREYTRIIIEEADRLRNLVDRMLLPNHTPKLRSINIHEVLERVCQLVELEIEDHITLVRDYDPSLPEIEADPDQLIQATLNIVRNAVQAIGTPPGTITLRTRPLRQFTIGHHRHRLVLSIQIIDTGPGIPPDMLETIFYPMVSGRAEGTGLGLTIAQNLINQHHGLIEVSSEPGHTVFNLLLPILTPRRT
ncbi:MAG: nitrogen regulation protein NR(II) [Pseudomonadota bacterium]